MHENKRCIYNSSTMGTPWSQIVSCCNSVKCRHVTNPLGKPGCPECDHCDEVLLCGSHVHMLNVLVWRRLITLKCVFSRIWEDWVHIFMIPSGCSWKECHYAANDEVFVAEIIPWPHVHFPTTVTSQPNLCQPFTESPKLKGRSWQCCTSQQLSALPCSKKALMKPLSP